MLFKKGYVLILMSMCTSLFIFCAGVKIPATFGVDFDVSMELTDRYDRNRAKISDEWVNIRGLYDRYIINDFVFFLEPLIPKRIHRIWIGSPLPDKEREFGETWIKNHPDWEYYLWTDTEIELLGLINKAAYDASKNWGEKSDIARYEILFRFGGLYVDTDFECLHPFDIFHHSCEFYAGMDYGVGMCCNVFNGLIGSIPGHPILKRCIEAIHSYSLHEKYDIDAIMVRTGPFLLTRSINESIQAGDEGRTVLFPVTYFYPWPNFYRDINQRSEILKWVRPETYAIHHWHVSWNY